MTATLLLLLPSLMVHPGCSTDPSSPDASTADCGPTLKPYRTACLPQLKLCTGDQVAQPGGGCKRVGVEECQGGIRTTPGGACEWVGPPLSCPHGWVATKDGWCEPTLPTTSCPSHKMEVLGQFACQKIGDCGAAPWGLITINSKTVFVDASYHGSDADGTKTRPFATIGAALKAAPSGAVVAVAAGSYAEDLALTRPVTLEGRCAELVTIKGQSTGATAAAVTASASGVTLRGVTVTGPAKGVVLQGSKATLERIAVEACGSQGIRANPGADLLVKDALVAENSSHGVYAVNATVTLERVVVRDSKPKDESQLEYGRGVEVEASSLIEASLTMKDCLVDGNHAGGVVLFGANGTLERTIVRRTQPKKSTKKAGIGVVAQRGYGRSSKLTLKGCVIAENHYKGIDVRGSDATLERTVVRDTLAAADNARSGYGLYVTPLDTDKVASSLTMRQSAVVRNQTIGLYLRGATANLELTRVSDTLPRKSDKTAGFGIYAGRAEVPTQLIMKRCIVSGNRTLGLGVFSSTATLDQCVVRSTEPRGKDALFGTGVQARSDTSVAELELNDCLVRGNIGAGIALHGAKGRIVRTIVRDTQPQQLNERHGLGIQAQWWKGRAAHATIRDTLISRNHRNGIRMLGATAEIERITVRDTSAQPSDLTSGVGIYVGPGGGSSKLTLSDSLFASNKSNGVAAWSSSVIIERTVVQDSKPEAASGGYGDGIEIGRLDGGAPGKLTLTDSLVERSHRAGLLMVAAGGMVRRSIFRSNQFSIALKKGAAPAIDEETNIYEQNTTDRITLGEFSSTIPSGIHLPPAPPFE